MSPSPGTKAAAAIAVLAVTGLLVSGALIPQHAQDRRSTRVPWQNGKPAKVVCMETTALASAQARHLYGLDADSGVPEYVWVRVCGEPTDAGQPALPDGMEALEATEREADGGAYQVEAWMPGGGFPCACSTGTACEWVGHDGGWQPAPLGLTLQQWRGEGCYRKTCVELLGTSSWPTACPKEGP